MITAMQSNTPPRSIVDTILSLFGFGYGHAHFKVNAAGHLVETSTVITVKMQKFETIELFVARLQREYDWRPKDELEIISNGGKFDVAKITRQPR
jgi:uncharacterized phosphosugar-binding protein